MVKQDVNKMLQAAFALIDANSQEKQLIEIPPIFPEMI
jgi:LacI family fructose operon transcriptional repressor